MKDREQTPARFRVEWVDEYHDRVAQLFQQASGLEDGITLTSHMLKHSRDAVGAILHDES